MQLSKHPLQCVRFFHMDMPPDDQVFAEFMAMRQLDRNMLADMGRDEAISDRPIHVSLFLRGDASTASLAWFSIKNGLICLFQFAMACGRWLNRVDIFAQLLKVNVCLFKKVMNDWCFTDVSHQPALGRKMTTTEVGTVTETTQDSFFEPAQVVAEVSGLSLARALIAVQQAKPMCARLFLATAKQCLIRLY